MGLQYIAGYSLVTELWHHKPARTQAAVPVNGMWAADREAVYRYITAISGTLLPNYVFYLLTCLLNYVFSAGASCLVNTVGHCHQSLSERKNVFFFHFDSTKT